MITIPSDPSADVEENFIEEREDRGELVGEDLGRMVVAGVETEEFSSSDRVSKIKFVRADSVGLGPNPKELAFDSVTVES